MEAPEADLDFDIGEGPVFNPPKPKKGRASWMAEDALAIPEQFKDPKLTYRFVRDEPRTIARRMSQGFVLANNSNGADVGNFRSPKGNNVDTTPNAGGDLVLMAAYKEVATAHVEQINRRTDEIERAITQEVREDAPVNGRTGRRAETRQRLVIE